MKVHGPQRPKTTMSRSNLPVMRPNDAPPTLNIVVLQENSDVYVCMFDLFLKHKSNPSINKWGGVCISHN